MMKIFKIIVALLITNCSFAQEYNIKYSAAIELGNINNWSINEASGLAASYNTPGAFWVHNDSGDGPNIFLVDSTGTLLTRGSVNNATSRDWEDMASFVKDGKSYLLIADFGDNPINKSEYWLYIIEEPVYNPESTSGNSYSIIRTIKFQYDNGSQNSESIGVDVTSNKIILVSKSGSGKGERYVHEIPLSIESGTETTTANLIAQFAMDATTAMDISNDGQRAIVLTYKDAYEFIRFHGTTWTDAFSNEPKVVKMPNRGGGEAIAYGTNAIDLYSVREGTKSPLWFLKGNVDEGAVFQVDMFEIEDLVDDKVWLNIQGYEQAIEMTDADKNKIFACKVNLDLDSSYNYYFSYQNGSDSLLDIMNETLSSACSNTSGYRNIHITFQNQMQKPVMFSACNERPSYALLKVDLLKTDDLFLDGLVGVYISDSDTIIEMKKVDTLNIYELMVSGEKEQYLFYKFCYQNGENSESDIVYETVPDECATNDGLRSFTFREELTELQAIVIGTCQEALPEGTDITDLPGVRIAGSNDDLPWVGPEWGGGSPEGQEVDKLIDNKNDTKYLVRAIDSWVELLAPNLTKVHAYTITSGGEMPSRDPRSWTLQGWNAESKIWESIHTVSGNPEWQNRLSRKSWEFENDKWFGKYRLHITEINGNEQQLMHMAEFQLFGEVGEEIDWSNNAKLKSLSVEGAELDPAFSPDVFEYDVVLPYNSIQIVIEAMAEDDKATVTGTGFSFLAFLTETPTVSVTAEDRITKNNYIINYTVSTTDPTTNVKSNDLSGLKVYPVPSTGIVRFSGLLNEEYDYSVYNNLGLVVAKGILCAGQEHLNLSHLKSGAYYLLLKINDKAQTHRILLSN